MASSRARLDGLEKTSLPSRERSRVPFSCSTPVPNSATTRARPGLAGATTWRAITSVSTTGTPSFSRMSETALLPLATPPVRTTSMGEPDWVSERPLADVPVMSVAACVYKYLATSVTLTAIDSHAGKASDEYHDSLPEWITLKLYWLALS